MLGTTLRLSQPEAQELHTRARSGVLRADDVRRARLILMLAEGQSWSTIQQALGCSSAYIARWQTRFAEQRLAGLFARHQGRPATKRTPRLEARILAWTRRPPTDGSTHWSSRKLARALGVNHMMVARVWRRAGLKPHRLERYMASDDPDFAPGGPSATALSTIGTIKWTYCDSSHRIIPTSDSAVTGH